MTSILTAATQMVRHPNPVRFLCSRFCLWLRIPLPILVTFCKKPLVQVRLTANPIAHQVWLRRNAQPDEVFVFTDFITDVSTVFDIGANIGTHALLAAALAPKGRVVACEPGVRTFAALQKNIQAAAAGSVEAYQCAVTDSDQPVFLYQPGRSDEQSRIQKTGDARTKVVSKRLDALMQDSDVNTIDFLKIDVEGAELPVLRSLGSRLRDVRTVYFECVPEAYQSFGYDPATLMAFLEEADFIVYEPQVTNGQTVYRDSTGLNYTTVSAKNLIATRQLPARCEVSSDVS